MTCSTQIRFLQREAKLNGDQREGDYLSIGCPVCGHTITKQLNNGASGNYWKDR